jgi:hypothetical protein
VEQSDGGCGRNRTGVDGFAGHCITILLRSLYIEIKPEIKKPRLVAAFIFLERETRFELATPTLARLCSTTELFPQ